MVRVLPPGTMEDYVSTSDQSTADSDRHEEGGSSDAPMISLRNVHKVYRLRSGKEVRALDGLSLDVAPGSIHGIVGTSGAGKSTLVRCLTSLERPTSGQVSVDGQDMTGLADRGASYPSQLSGGQKQRVGIARALADDPAVLLCDEPTSALDPETTRSILDLIKNVRDTLGLTVIIITHEMSVVRQVCDSVSLLEAGRIVESGRLEDIVLDVDSRLSREIVPFPKVPEAAVAHGESVIDVSITAHPGQPAAVALMSMVAELGGDIAAGVFETIGQAQIGRLAVTVPGSDTEQAVSTLRQAGIAAEVRS